MVRKRATPEFRKNQIIAAADLVLLEVGIERFTVDQVIGKAKIAKGTVYNYYHDKDGMLAELGYKALALLYQHFNTAIEQHSSSIAQVKAICKTTYTYYKMYPQYFDLISYMERPDFNIAVVDYLKLSDDITQMVNKVLIKGHEKGEIKPSLQPQMITYIIWACTVGVVQFVETKKKLLKNHHEINTEHMLDVFADMITEGIKK
ncbi:TetR/AcrR family transcriptional regulator [Fulvivirga sp. M361]|uniref:TetR/AcrR family transcriptional regulator n=1 Tax=Fulvivirga sp. M361 TaxID=2594266 RepID=UPI00117B28BB|nr:TetR/AcrR family transcriptional regulator [Fulvivirga sp. M361]TRX62679.1 TetR/AcrR family transcriptional regulator [Fulvivirga sp. M361]